MQAELDILAEKAEELSEEVVQQLQSIAERKGIDVWEAQRSREYAEWKKLNDVLSG